MMMYHHLSETANSQLYIAGESYAGQHIPYIAQAILEHNKVHGDVPVAPPYPLIVAFQIEGPVNR
jgi:carboxypeptidase C (cathepsin A)